MAAGLIGTTGPVRILVVGSWLGYAVVLVGSIPIPSEAILGFVFGVVAVLVGVSASVAALLNFRLWRILALVAGGIFLAGYAVRLAVWANTSAQTWGTSLVQALATVLRDIWLIAQHLYQTSGGIGLVPYAFSVFAMPPLQLAIIWLLRASPNPSLQGTRDEAAPLSSGYRDFPEKQLVFLF